ncbi:MAG TPA: carboxypeptidase regulatory-like domain-containing protein [Vicinamibacteria bacterium]|jgi:plastocyanin
MGSFVGRAALAAGVCAVTQVAAAGTITGAVLYDGKVPNLKPLAVAAEPMCAKKHPTVPNEALVLGAGNAMANVVVRVVGGLPAGKSYPAPTTPVTMDQVGCQYVPHVIGLMAGQPFKVLNNDGVLHNVHALPKVNKPFNMAMPPTRKEATESFAKEEGMFVVKCDVHPWMQSYVGVFSHPFFAVTGSDGKFTIANLPAGTYEVEAWHEKLGTQKTSVTVGASDTKSAAFKFSPPAAK